jgi:protoporphyrinogen oxidase
MTVMFPNLKRERWAIVGGGMLGMTLAHRLAQQGQDVTLFEAAGEPGGLAGAWKLGDVVWDRHYHVTLMSDSHLRALLGELGLESEIQWVQTRTGFYTDGRLYSMSNTLEFLRFPPLTMVDKLRLAITILYASKIKNWKRLEKIPVDSWLRRWSGRHTFERIWLPLLRAKLGDTYKQTSAAFIWATIARMYRARRSGLKKEMFGYVPGGYARILARFVQILEREKVCIKYRHQAKTVEPAPGGRLHVEFSNGNREFFDQVVLTLPAPLVGRICPALSGEEKSKLERTQYLGVICASLLLNRPLTNFYVTNITDSWVPFTAVIEMSALVDRRHFDGNALVYLPKYVTPDDPAYALSDEQLEERFVGGLSWMYPQFRRRDLKCFRVSRPRYVFALSTLNYSQGLPPMKTSVPGIHIVNSAHIVNGTLNVNETIQLAERAMTSLMSQPGTTPLALAS